MADSSLKTELNKSLDGRFKRSTDYESVAVLLIYWKGCTDRGYKEEAQQVGQLFRDDFGYSVEYYEIPAADTCELDLDTRINTFLVDNRRPETLLIIHYGGHGNPDDDHGQMHESVWCA